MQGQEDKYISGEEYQSRQYGKPPRKGVSPLVWLAVAVVIAGAGVCGTLVYLKHNNTNNTNYTTGTTNNTGPSNGGNISPNNQYSAGGGTPSGCTSGCSVQTLGGGSGGQTLVVHTGTVTAVNDSSITIQPSGSGSTETFSITSSTQIFNGNSNTALSPSDIRTGETVNVNTASSSGNQAVVIVVNPSGN